MRHRTRPDGRCFVFGEPDDELSSGDLHTIMDASDAEKLCALEDSGFVPHRRELVMRLPTDPRASGLAETAPPGGIALVRADAVEEARLRLLGGAGEGHATTQRKREHARPGEGDLGVGE